MKRFIACFIISLIGLSMLMQPSVMAIDEDLDTIAIYNPFYHVFYDTTLDETTWVKGSYIETPYLIADSAYVGGKVKISDAGVDVETAVAQAFKAEYNVSSQLGAWVHGVKVEFTRTADIQPVTGCWFGGQFVLNAGTTAWDDINKPAYAIQGIIKGDQWDGVQDVNAGRFELQSSGSVRDIVYILANTGTSVSSSMLYMPTHISLTNMIQLNAQSTSTITNAIDILSGAGSSFNYGIDFGDATINTAEFKLGNGALIYSKHIDSLIITEANVKIVGNLLATTYLNLPKVDSAIYADSAVWADQLDGYNEDYFLDTNDVTGLTGHDSTNFLYSDTVDIGEFISKLGTKVFDINLDSNTIVIGEGAWATGEGKDHVVIGINALADNTTGTDNVAIGEYAMQHNTTGGANFALGASALRNGTDGDYNIAIGGIAMYTTTGGAHWNTAIGAQAFYYMTTGDYNVAIGGNAGQYYTTGIQSTFVGYAAGQAYQCDGGENYNTAIGAYSGARVKGIYNTYIGHGAGLYSTGNYNTFIGSSTGYNTITGESNVFIGYQAGYNLNTVSNQLLIANSATDSLIYGEFDNHYVFIKDSLAVSSIVVDKAYIGGGEQLVKFTKIGSHLAIVLNASADTFWIAADTTGF